MSSVLVRSRCFPSTSWMCAAERRATASTTTLSSMSPRWASVLVVSDPGSTTTTLPVATQSAVTAALQWLAAKGDAENKCILLTTGGSGEDATTTMALPQGVTHHVHAQTTTTTASEMIVVETAANAIQQAAVQYTPDCIMGTATKWGSSVIPRAAALLHDSPLADVVEIVDARKWVVTLCVVM